MIVKNLSTDNLATYPPLLCLAVALPPTLHDA